MRRRKQRVCERSVEAQAVDDRLIRREGDSKSLPHQAFDLASAKTGVCMTEPHGLPERVPQVAARTAGLAGRTGKLDAVCRSA